MNVEIGTEAAQVPHSVSEPGSLDPDPDIGFLVNLDPDPDPGF